MDNTVTRLSDDFDEFDMEESSTSVTAADITGLDDFEFDSEDGDSGEEDSNEVQGMISELIVNGYIVSDNMSYYTIKALYDRLYFAANMGRNNEFLRKCDELYTVFKNTLQGRAAYFKNSHAKTPQTYNIFVDSKDTELSIIDQSVRSNVLNKILAMSFEEIAAIDIEEMVEEEYQFLLEHHRDLTVINSDVGRLRRHITRTVTDSINRNLKTITDMEDVEITESNSIVKHVCPVSMDNVIKQIFTEDNRYYFLDKKGNHVVVNTPVIHLLSCRGDTKPVVCWIPCLFESEGETYGFSAEDYMTFLQATQGLFKDRSTSRSDVVDLGISINMFTQINDHILFNAPEELVEEKEYVFEKYSLTVDNAEIKEACHKLRSYTKPSPSSFNLEDIARSFCAQTNSDYHAMFLQAMIGIVSCFDLNAYYKNTINLTPIMRFNCDINFLNSITSIDVMTDKIIRTMYEGYYKQSMPGYADISLVEKMIADISDMREKYITKRMTVLHYLRSNATKFRYIESSKYDSCPLDLFAQYLDEDSYSIFVTIANSVIITTIAPDFLAGYSFQSKSYIDKNITKSSSPNGLCNVMRSIASKLKIHSTEEWESLDCMFDSSAIDIIKSMHYDNYGGVPAMIQQLLDSIDTNTYASEIQILNDKMDTIRNAQSFEELPVDIITALTSLSLYIQSHADDDYQEKITVNAFTDFALTLDANSVTKWLGVTAEEITPIQTDLKSFFDFQQMKYAREISEGSIGISKYIIDLLFSKKTETVSDSNYEDMLSAKFYKDGIKYLLTAGDRVSNANVATLTDEERILYAQDQRISQSITDDGGAQAVEIWLSKYLRYLGV